MEINSGAEMGAISKGEVMPSSLHSRIRQIVRLGAMLACAVFAATLLIEPAAGQSGLGNGRIEGTVTDESGGEVAGARVTTRNDATAVTTVQDSDPRGHFLFPYLTPGNYHVSVERDGSKTKQMDNVVVAELTVAVHVRRE
jgi:hypothetical protein